MSPLRCRVNTTCPPFSSISNVAEVNWTCELGGGVGVGVGLALGEGLAVGDALGDAVGDGAGLPGQAPGPAVLSTKPETMPLKGDDAVIPSEAKVEPVVFTTTTKLCSAGTVNE